MTGPVHATCRGCDAAERRLRKTAQPQTCGRCKTEWRYGDPSQHWLWRSAKADMAALARCPAIAAMPYDPSPGGVLLLSEAAEHAAAILGEDTARQAEEARQRLALLEAHPHPDAKRFAAVVRYAYGERGKVLDGWESAAVAVAKRFAKPGERAAFRRWLDRAEVTLTLAERDEINARAFGNALIGVATKAYEQGEFDPLFQPEPQSFRERFVGKIADRWEHYREKLLGPRSTPAIDEGGDEFKLNHGEP